LVVVGAFFLPVRLLAPANTATTDAPKNTSTYKIPYFYPYYYGYTG